MSTFRSQGTISAAPSNPILFQDVVYLNAQPPPRTITANSIGSFDLIVRNAGQIMQFFTSDEPSTIKLNVTITVNPPNLIQVSSEVNNIRIVQRTAQFVSITFTNQLDATYSFFFDSNRRLSQTNIVGSFTLKIVENDNLNNPDAIFVNDNMANITNEFANLNNSNAIFTNNNMRNIKNELAREIIRINDTSSISSSSEFCDYSNIPRIEIKWLLTDILDFNIGTLNFLVTDIHKYNGYHCEPKLVCPKKRIFETEFVKYPQFQKVVRGDVCRNKYNDECIDETKGTLSQKVKFLIKKFDIDLPYLDFFSLLAFYASARYILSGLLYGKFSVKFLLGKFYEQFLIDLVNSRFRKFIIIFTNDEPVINFIGYEKYFIYDLDDETKRDNIWTNNNCGNTQEYCGNTQKCSILIKPRET